MHVHTFAGIGRASSNRRHWLGLASRDNNRPNVSVASNHEKGENTGETRGDLSGESHGSTTRRILGLISRAITSNQRYSFLPSFLSSSLVFDTLENLDQPSTFLRSREREREREVNRAGSLARRRRVFGRSAADESRITCDRNSFGQKKMAIRSGEAREFRKIRLPYREITNGAS